MNPVVSHPDHNFVPFNTLTQTLHEYRIYGRWGPFLFRECKEMFASEEDIAQTKDGVISGGFDCLYVSARDFVRRK